MWIFQFCSHHLRIMFASVLHYVPIILHYPTALRAIPATVPTHGLRIGLECSNPFGSWTVPGQVRFKIQMSSGCYIKACQKCKQTAKTTLQNTITKSDPESKKNLTEMKSKIVKNEGSEGSGVPWGEVWEPWWRPGAPRAPKMSENHIRGLPWDPPSGDNFRHFFWFFDVFFVCFLEGRFEGLPGAM